jgi:hypothetical protein
MTDRAPTPDRETEADAELERRLRAAFLAAAAPEAPASVLAEAARLASAPDVRTRPRLGGWRSPGWIAVVLGLTAILVGSVFSGGSSPAPSIPASASESATADPSAGASGACAVSPGTMHGTWWREIGGPNAFFNWEEAALPAQPYPWKLIVRFDPDATSQFVSVWGDHLESGERVIGTPNGRMDPAGIYRFDTPAPDLPGGWYLFEQPLPAAGCWRLSAAIDGRVVGTAFVEIGGPGAPLPSPSPTAGPTPGLGETVQPAADDILPLAGLDGVPGMLQCGDTPFPFDALGAPTGAEDGVGPEFSVLRRVARDDPDLGGDLGPDPTFREVARDADAVAFLYERPDLALLEDRFVYVEVEWTGVGWRVGHYGDCLPRAVWPPGYGRATWTLDPDFAPPDAETRTLHILVHEEACSGGRSATGRISPAFVTVHPLQLVIELFVQARPGGGDCPANIPTPATLPLPAPLGDRTLVDAGAMGGGGTGG